MDKVFSENFDFIISHISLRIRSVLAAMNETVKSEVQEIRLRAGRPVVIVTSKGSSFLTANSRLSLIYSDNCVKAGENEIYDTLNKMCGYSMHSHFEDLLNGYVTLKNGARVGVCGTAVYDGCEVKTVKDITGLNIRINRNINGAADSLFNSVFSDGPQNLLIAGAPSSGKTTLLKDIARQFSSGRTGRYYKVCVVDERKELFSQNAQADILGPNTDIIYGFPKDKGISIAIRTLSPEIIICDEIGSASQTQKILYGLNSGVRFILSVHAQSPEELKNKTAVMSLISEGGFKNIAFLSGSSRPGEIKEIVKAESLRYENTDNGAVYGVRSGGLYACGKAN